MPTPHWTTYTISPDATHHIAGERAAYSARFWEVLKFHAPGLAPVLDGSGAYHVTPDGAAAYSARFVRTFGFYDGRAAVESQDGWLHILPRRGGAVRCAVRVGGQFSGRAMPRPRAGRRLFSYTDGRARGVFRALRIRRRFPRRLRGRSRTPTGCIRILTRTASNFTDGGFWIWTCSTRDTPARGTRTAGITSTRRARRFTPRDSRRSSRSTMGRRGSRVSTGRCRL